MGRVGEPMVQRAGGDGALPKAQPGWPPPPPFTVSDTSASRVGSAYEAGHVFSFSPDNDSRWRWAASRRAHLLCRAALPQARTRPQRCGQSWPWPLHVASGYVQHPAQGTRGVFPAHAGCQLAMGHIGHCLRLRVAWHRLSWPRSPSWPGAGGSTAPVLALGLSQWLSQWLSLPCGPFLSPGLTLLGSGASLYRVPLHPQTIPLAALPAHAGPFPSDLAGPHLTPPRAGRISGAWEAARAWGGGAVRAAGPSAPALPQTGLG